MVILTNEMDGESQLGSTTIPNIIGVQESFNQALVLVIQALVLVIRGSPDWLLVTFGIREYPFLAVCEPDRLSLPKSSTLAEAIIHHT
jgi:hypothetical protein